MPYQNLSQLELESVCGGESYIILYEGEGESEFTPNMQQEGLDLIAYEGGQHIV